MTEQIPITEEAAILIGIMHAQEIPHIRSDRKRIEIYDVIERLEGALKIDDKPIIDVSMQFLRDYVQLEEVLPKDCILDALATITKAEELLPVVQEWHHDELSQCIRYLRAAMTYGDRGMTEKETSILKSSCRDANRARGIAAWLEESRSIGAQS